MRIDRVTRGGSTFLKKPVQTIIALGILLLTAAPVLAEGFWDGQSYFGFSAMLSGARNSRVDDATGAPAPVFATGAEVVTNVGYGVAGYYGWLFDSNWRIEGELSRRGVQLDNIAGPAGTASLKGDLTINSLFINVVKDFRSKAFVTPYLGLGAGLGIHELDLETVNGALGLSKRTPFTPAFQLMFGMELEVGEDMDIIVGYRYVNFWAPDYTEFSYDFVDFHNFEMGLRFYPEDW